MPNYTILLVDYEPRSVERSRRPLVAAGFKIHLASDGVSALEAFERLRPDLVLIEAMLPKKNGFEVCQEIRRSPSGTHTPILITTAVYKGRKYRSQALHVHGASEYIEKPIADDQLVAIVRQFLQTSTKSSGRTSDDHAEDTIVSPRPLGGGPAAAGPAGRTAGAPTAAAPSGPVLTKMNAAASRVAQPTVAGAVLPDSASVLVAAVSGPAASPVGTGPSVGTTQSLAASSTWRAAADALIGGLTEDEISDRLDELLPFGPSGSATGTLESQEGKETANAFDLEAAADVLAGTDPEFDALLAGGSTTTSPLGPTVSVGATDREERVPPAATPARGATAAAVVPLDPSRSKKRGKKKNFTAASPEPPAALSVVAVPKHAEPAAGERASATMDAATTDAEIVAIGRRTPLWVWMVLITAVIAITVGGYFAFFHTGSSASATPVGSAPSVKARPTPAPIATPPATPPVETAVSGLPAAAAPSFTRSAAASPIQKSPPAPPSPRDKAPNSVAADPRTSATKPSSANTETRVPVSAPAAEPPPAVSKPGEAPLAGPAAPAPGPGVAATRPEVTVVDPNLGIEAVPVHIAAPVPARTETPRQVQQGDILPLADTDQPPVALNRPPPSYPRRARIAAQQGNVDLSLLVDETGRVADVRVVSAENDDFGGAASKAARNWTYKPALKNGVRVQVWKPERVIFKL